MTRLVTMTWMVTAVRRSLWLVLIGAAGGVTWSWWRDRTAPPAPPTPPEWPPLEPTSTGATDTSSIAPDTASDAVTDLWLLPAPDGSCPDSHLIKANGNSGIFHVPGGRFYDRTKAERCYATAADAVTDGYRPAKA